MTLASLAPGLDWGSDDEEVVILPENDDDERNLRLVVDQTPPRERERRFGSLRGIIQSSADLEDPLPDFDAYRNL
jgi:hypothetical protein